jgi:CheY-like chemotaxis protein
MRIRLRSASTEQAGAKVEMSDKLRGLHILVIDDNADDRELARVVLEQQGASVEVASSVAAGLAAFARRAPDVVVCDLMFGSGKPTGYSFIDAVGRAPDDPGERVPVAVITAYDWDIPPSRLAAAGFDDVCSKPCEPASLIQLVARLTGRGTSVN